MLTPTAYRLGRFLNLTNLDSRTINLIHTTDCYLDQRAHDLIHAHKKRTPLRPLSTTQKTILPDVTIEYDALPSKRSIRLLELQYSNIFNGPIVTTLQTYNLDDTPSFRALSYTWGKPYHDIHTEDVEEPSKLAATIWCNGKRTPVTQNLLDALNSLMNLDITGAYMG
ncbi:hypothetical protein N431DRAFT_177848 [Stipitochalara longipes BDJ]|nr:hypothetical protein N431DRAFT_177848 [Stipitochalara longipes BDJ]